MPLPLALKAFVDAKRILTGSLDVRPIKAQMGMGILRAKSPAMIDKEIGVYLLALVSVDPALGLFGIETVW